MILSDLRLESSITRCIFINVIVPKLEYAGEVWEGNSKLVKQIETVRMTAVIKCARMLKYDEYCGIKSRHGNVPM